MTRSYGGGGGDLVDKGLLFNEWLFSRSIWI